MKITFFLRDDKTIIINNSEWTKPDIITLMKGNFIQLVSMGLILPVINILYVLYEEDIEPEKVKRKSWIGKLKRRKNEPQHK